uniref:ERAP1-like C-terminal domain-containing protein n=1 Tax=Streptomyces shenzhenensis TaxID=943815 RepID=UPI0015F0DBA3
AGDDVDLHWRALVREAELGGDITAPSAALLERDPDPDAWVRALTVRAALPDPAAKDEVWQRLAVDREVPVHAVAPVAAAFWRPGQDAQLAPYAERYLAAVPQLHQGGMIPAMTYATQLFPPYAVDAAYIEKAQRTAREAAPVVRNTLLGRADAVRRMLRARSATA